MMCRYRPTCYITNVLTHFEWPSVNEMLLFWRNLGFGVAISGYFGQGQSDNGDKTIGIAIIYKMYEHGCISN